MIFVIFSSNHRTIADDRQAYSVTEELSEEVNTREDSKLSDGSVILLITEMRLR